MPRTLPFDAFLGLLRAREYGVGLHEYTAVANLLERWEGVDLAELADALAALIGRSDEEVDGIRRHFLELYAPPVPPPPVAPPVDRWLWLRWRTWSLAILALATLIVIVIAVTGRTPPPAPPVTSITPPVFSPAQTEAVPLPPPPAPPMPAPPQRVDRTVLGGVAGGSFLLLLTGLWALKQKEEHQLWVANAWPSLRATLPGPFHVDEGSRVQLARLPKTDVEAAANLLGRVFSKSALGRQLDVKATLRATLRRGLMPTLVTKPRRVAQPIVVLLDVCQEMRLWDAKVQGFLRDLRRQGVALHLYYFDGDLSRLSERPHRPASSIDVLFRRRRDEPVLIVSSGVGLPAMMEARDRPWLRLLGRRPRTTWLTPVVDVRLWPPQLRELPIGVWPMSRRGLANAARQLADAEASFGVLAREPLAAEGWVTREDIERLKRLASLVPNPTPTLLDSLRRQFAPDISDAAILHLMNEGDGPSAPTVKLKDDQVRHHAGMTRRESPELEASVRTAIVQALRDSEPVQGSVAHERWRIALEVQRLEIAHLTGSAADGAAAVAALRSLAQGPLGVEVGEAMRLLPPTAETGARQHEIHDAQRRFLHSTEGRSRLAAVRPLRWSWPGARELAPAAAMAALLLFILLEVSLLPARAVEHVADAYGLEYEPPRSAAIPSLNLTLVQQDSAIPRRVDLYRGDQRFRAGITVTPDRPTRIELGSSDTGFHYQVRGRMGEGNFAVSPWVWVTTDKLSFVLIDASPWANVTIHDGPTATPMQQTPFTAALLPGTYTVRFENPVLGGASDVSRTLTIPAAPVFRVTLPNFDPARTVDTLLPPGARN